MLPPSSSFPHRYEEKVQYALECVSFNAAHLIEMSKVMGGGGVAGNRKRLLDMDEEDRGVEVWGEGVQCERGSLFVDTFSYSLQNNSKWKRAPTMSVWG